MSLAIVVALGLVGGCILILGGLWVCMYLIELTERRAVSKFQRKPVRAGSRLTREDVLRRLK